MDQPYRCGQGTQLEQPSQQSEEFNSHVDAPTEVVLNNTLGNQAEMLNSGSNWTAQARTEKEDPSQES